MNMYHTYHYGMVQNRGNASHSLFARGPESFANGLRSRFVVGVCEYMCETQKICQFGLLVSAFGQSTSVCRPLFSLRSTHYCFTVFVTASVNSPTLPN